MTDAFDGFFDRDYLASEAAREAHEAFQEDAEWWLDMQAGRLAAPEDLTPNRGQVEA